MLAPQLCGRRRPAIPEMHPRHEPIESRETEAIPVLLGRASGAQACLLLEACGVEGAKGDSSDVLAPALRGIGLHDTPETSLQAADLPLELKVTCTTITNTMLGV